MTKIFSSQYSPLLTTFSYGDNKGDLNIIKFNNSADIDKINITTSAIYSLSYINESSVAYSSDSSIGIYDINTNVKNSIPISIGYEINSIINTTNNIYSGSGNGYILSHDIRTYEKVAVYSGHKDSIYSIAISEENNILASGSEDHTVSFFDIRNSKKLKSLNFTNYVSQIRINWPFLFVAAANCVYIYEMCTLEIVAMIPCSCTPTALEIVNNSIIVGGRDGILSNFSMSGKLFYTFNASGEIWTIAVPSKSLDTLPSDNSNKYDSFLTASCIASGNKIYSFDKNISLPPLKYEL